MKKASGIMLALVLVLGIIGTATPVQAATIALWDGVTTKNPGDTVTAIDDTYVYSDVTNVPHGNEGLLKLKTVSGPSIKNYALVGFKDLFSLLPATNVSGQTLSISQATLELGMYTTAGSGPVEVATLVTPWLAAKSAGNNEVNVTWDYSDFDGGTHWASGGHFSATDIDTTGSTTTNVPAVLNGLNDFDVTAIVQNMYTAKANNGFVLWATQANSQELRLNSSEAGSAWGQPKLTIDYSYVPEPATMALLAIGGIGVVLRRRRS